MVGGGAGVALAMEEGVGVAVDAVGVVAVVGGFSVDMRVGVDVGVMEGVTNAVVLLVAGADVVAGIVAEAEMLRVGVSV